MPSTLVYEAGHAVPRMIPWRAHELYGFNDAYSICCKTDICHVPRNTIREQRMLTQRA